VDFRPLSVEFPSVLASRSHLELVRTCTVDADTWRDATSFDAFDELAARSRSGEMVIRGDGNVELVALQVLTRYQRYVDRRNRASSTATFDVVVRAHRALHEERGPIGSADLARALDAWQWLLRLDPESGLEAQLVVLLRDVDRIEDDDGETWLRAPRLLVGRLLDTGTTGERAFELLRAAGFDAGVAGRVRDLVGQADVDDPLRPVFDPLRLVEDAETLSFLSLSSSSYLDAFGRDLARRKIATMLRRLGPAARRKLALVRFRPDVFSVVREAA
jgi:hypothetical protein